MKYHNYILLMIMCACSSPKKTTEEWTPLFNEIDLTGWDTFLGPPFIQGDSTPLDSLTFPGWNNDSLRVYSVVNLDNQNVIRISGQQWGGLVSKEEYQNYHLQIEFKWGDEKWYPRDSTIMDSGLLYHSVDDQRDLFWLRSQEFQIQQGDCGDYWGVAGAMVDIRAKMNQDSIWQYDATANPLTFSEGQPNGRHCKKHPDAERPTGEWNVIDLYCFGGTSYHVLNGTLQMILENSRHSVSGVLRPLTKGKIQLQSESAEIYFRNINIRPISELPDARSFK